MHSSPSSEFDEYAGNYDEALAMGLSITGETKEYYASARVRWLARRLATAKWPVRTVLDFGCGTGSGVPFLFDGLDAKLAPRSTLTVKATAPDGSSKSFTVL